MTKEPEDHVVDVWIALLRARDIAFGKVETAFKENGFPHFSWYDVLWELDKSDSAGLRPYEIERNLLLKQYGLSRLLKRMETQGLVQIEPCLDDGRGNKVVITTKGKKIRQSMWGVYSKMIQSTLGNKLSKKQCEQLSILLKELVIH